MLSPCCRLDSSAACMLKEVFFTCSMTLTLDGTQQMFSTIRQFVDLQANFTQLALDPNGNDVAALLKGKFR